MVADIVGICSSHPDPDMWFPDMDNGRPTQAKVVALAERVEHAVKLCNECPVMVECLAEGMKEENLPHGIWGGLLAGERLATLGKRREDFPPQSDKGKAMDLFVRLEPWLRW